MQMSDSTKTTHAYVCNKTTARKLSEMVQQCMISVKAIIGLTVSYEARSIIN